MAYTKYSLTPADNNAAPPNGAPEGMLPSAVNDTMRDMMAQIRDVGDGIRGGTYTMTAPVITGGSISGATGSFSTLAASGVATFSAGTVSAPAITTTGDTNTGIFFPAADTIAFTEGGVESMRITSAGLVGIGTSSPTTNLEVSSTGDTIVTINAANNNDSKLVFSEAGSAEYSIIMDGLSGSTQSLQFYNNRTATEAMRITSAGFVGIGTSSPAAKLEIAQNADNTDGPKLRIANNGNTLSNGQLIGGIDFFNGDDSGEGVGAYIYSIGRIFGQDLRFATGGTTERMRIDSSGNMGIGLTSPAVRLDVNGGGTSLSGTAEVNVQITQNTTTKRGLLLGYDNTSQIGIIGANSAGNNSSLAFWTYNSAWAEKMRLDASGNLLVGKTSATITTAGAPVYFGALSATRDAEVVATINRLTNDGGLVSFRQDSTEEGSISVSGTTVSYNGGHLSRWSQLPDGSKDESIVKGTVLSNLDDMCIWEKDGVVAANEQLNKMKVSDVEGDTNVAGVFVNWTIDEDYGVDDMNIAMTGDMIIRIADGVVVQKGDLLMSAGDGTAKPQGDDIVRSKTIAKVTSNYVTCTYADGSYCVPCVLMAC
jgi:hypothetical protein